MRDLGRNLRAFAAAARREWRTALRYPDPFVGALVWPLVIPLLYLFQVHAFAGGSPAAEQAFTARAGTADLAGFLYVGWLVSSWLNTMMVEIGHSLRSQLLQGSVETALLSPASRLAILLGPAPVHGVLGVFTYAAVLVTVVAGYGVHLTATAVLTGLVLLLAAGLAFAMIGAVLANAVLVLRNADPLIDAFRALFAVLCGFTFPLAVLPGWAHQLANRLPPTWVVSSLRSTLLSTPPVWSLLAVLLALAGVAAAVAAVAGGGFALAERYARRTGQLGGY
jgi:ABC-2 type transport system permease protein